MLRGRRHVGVLLAAVLVAGCGSQSEAPARPEPQAQMGFTQLISEEGTGNGLLRVTNTGDAPLEVTSVALEWEGYPDATRSAADPVIDPGATIDVKLALPEPDCEVEPRGDVVGVVRSRQGTVRGPLTAAATTYVGRLWRAQCDERLVRESVDLDYSERWRVVGQGVDARAAGTLVLTRRGSDEDVEVVDLVGSVLHDLRLPGARGLPRDRDTASLPLEIVPGNRCDEHARGQATAPFDFLARVRLGERTVGLPLRVPLAAKTAAGEALDRACDARAVARDR